MTSMASTSTTKSMTVLFSDYFSHGIKKTCVVEDSAMSKILHSIQQSCKNNFMQASFCFCLKWWATYIFWFHHYHQTTCFICLVGGSETTMSTTGAVDWSLQLQSEHATTMVRKCSPWVPGTSPLWLQVLHCTGVMALQGTLEGEVLLCCLILKVYYDNGCNYNRVCRVCLLMYGVLRIKMWCKIKAVVSWWCTIKLRKSYSDAQVK